MTMNSGVWQKALFLSLAILFIFPSGLWAASPKQAKNSPAEAGPQDKANFPVILVSDRYLPHAPEHLELCGEAVPLHDPFVAEQLDREFTIAVHDQAQVVMWLKRARRYFPYISRMLKQSGLPDDLKYLAVAESALLRQIGSHAGAVGLWQFLRRTGIRYGLQRNRWFDDRRNPEKATKAAIGYLKDLHKEFGSWPLAMAAYNSGSQRVSQAIKEQDTRDYYYLYLPRETMRYVYRIMAAKIILSDPTKYGYNLPDDKLYKPWPARNVTLHLKKTTHLRLLAKAAGTSVRILMELNPELRTLYLPYGTHVIKVPKDANKDLVAQFDAPQAKTGEVAEPPTPRNKHWVVKPGDTLSKISHKTGVDIKVLRKANGIKGSVIKLGQKLVIPSSE